MRVAHAAAEDIRAALDYALGRVTLDPMLFDTNGCAVRAALRAADGGAPVVIHAALGG